MPAIEVVAHRGASAYAPEHGFAAYDLALEMGADVLELDVRATRDGTPVVLHDPTLERTTGDPRAVAEVTLDELPSFAQPLTLDAVLDRYGAGTRWLVELKDPDPDLVTAVAGAVVSHGLLEQTTIQSFDHLALRHVRRLCPDLAVAPLLSEDATVPQILAALRRASRYAGAVGVPHAACTAAVSRAARANGLRLRAWTVNDDDDMARLLAAGVEGLITDRPDRARHAVTAIAALVTAA